MRELTTKFGTYRIGKYEKKTGKSIIELIDVGNLEVNKIVELIKLGNPNIPIDDQEKAYDLLDNYLAKSDENSLITAYIDILNELNSDLKLFIGVDMNAMKEKLKKETNELTTKVNNMVDNA